MNKWNGKYSHVRLVKILYNVKLISIIDKAKS